MLKLCQRFVFMVTCNESSLRYYYYRHRIILTYVAHLAVSRTPCQLSRGTPSTSSIVCTLSQLIFRPPSRISYAMPTIARNSVYVKYSLYLIQTCVRISPHRRGRQRQENHNLPTLLTGRPCVVASSKRRSAKRAPIPESSYHSVLPGS